MVKNESGRLRQSCKPIKSRPQRILTHTNPTRTNPIVSMRGMFYESLAEVVNIWT